MTQLYIDQQQEQFVTRKGFALSSDAPGELQEASGLFKSALSKATEWDRDSPEDSRVRTGTCEGGSGGSNDVCECLWSGLPFTNDVDAQG